MDIQIKNNRLENHCEQSTADGLKTLFLEKINIEKYIAEHNEEKNDTNSKQKKIKKKDIVKPNIQELELKCYEYIQVNNIKIYNGVIPNKKATMENNVKLLQSIVSRNVFTTLIPSVLSVQGGFTNILFNEETKMPFSKIPNKDFSTIIKIGSNFGEIYVFPNIYEPHSLEDMIKSVRELSPEQLIIGCDCQPSIDIQKIKTLLCELKKKKDRYKIIAKYFNPDHLETNGISKSRINKLIKNFQSIAKFRVTDKESINELYHVIDNVIKKEDIHSCNEYIDLIVSIITIFTKYARACKCWKKCQYTNMFSQNKRDCYNKTKKTSKRKKQGTGLYFSSQITFDIYNKSNQKISKIKLFRNGTFQVPGVKQPDMRDIIEPLTILKNYWNYIYPEHFSELSYMLSNMRNYKCLLNDPTLTILLNRLEDILYFEKDLPKYPLLSCDYIELLSCMNFTNDINEKIFQYMPYSFYTIAEITNNPERCPGLLIKFNRPIPSKEQKKLTVKILSSGKINFGGGNSELEVYEIYYWLQHIFTKYWSEVIYDPRNYPFEEVSCDSADYQSIYDSE